MSDRPRQKALDGADVVVVGGGIAGQATAAAIAGRGASVVLVDKEAVPGAEGSGRAQGSLRLQGRAAAEFPLAKEAIDLWKRVDEDADIELSFGGNIYLCDDPAEMPLLRSLVDEAHRAGLQSVKLLDPVEAREVMPAATGPYAAAMWSPHDAQCQPDKATRYFADLARRRHTRQYYGIRALEVIVASDRVTGVLTERGVITADAVVIAGGVWTPHLARTAGVRIPLMPVFISQCETTPTVTRFAPTVRAFGCGCRQRPNGQIVLGAGMNTVVEHRLTLASLQDSRLWLSRLGANRRHVRLRLDGRTTRGQIRRRSAFATDLIPKERERPANRNAMTAALRALHELLPGTRDARIARSWTGMVDLSADGLPIIDGHAGPAGLVVITGMSGHGLALGPVTGEIAADLSLDGRTSRPIHPFRVARFSEESVPVPEKMI